MLERQQTKLVSGLKEMYHLLQNASGWKGPSLDESYGHPLTHNILSALDLIKFFVGKCVLLSPSPRARFRAGSGAG
jgi:hypothetical protein